MLKLILGDKYCRIQYIFVGILGVLMLSQMTRVTATESLSAQENQQTSIKTLLIVGDSLSAAYQMPVEKGWVELVSQKYLPKGWKIINASISGDTTANGLARLPYLLSTHQPQAVMIALGANDGLQGKSFEELSMQLTQLVTQSQKVASKVFLVEMVLPPNYGQDYIQAFQAVYKQVATAAGIPLMTLNYAMLLSNPDYLQADGLHPSVQAQPLIADHIGQLLFDLLSSDVTK